MVFTRTSFENILTDAFSNKYPTFDKQLLQKAVKHVTKDTDINFLNNVFNPEDILNQMISDFALPVLEVYQELRLRQFNIYYHGMYSWFN